MLYDSYFNVHIYKMFYYMYKPGKGKVLWGGSHKLKKTENVCHLS